MIQVRCSTALLLSDFVVSPREFPNQRSWQVILAPPGRQMGRAVGTNGRNESQALLFDHLFHSFSEHARNRVTKRPTGPAQNLARDIVQGGLFS
jgi:hypothetical protein